METEALNNSISTDAVNPVTGSQALKEPEQESVSVSKDKVSAPVEQQQGQMIDPLATLQNDDMLQSIVQQLKDAGATEEEEWQQANDWLNSSNMQSQQPKKEENVSYIGDTIKGVVSAPLKFVENTAEAVAGTADWIAEVFGGDIASKEELDFDWVPDFIKPKTALGRTGQSILAFALGWFSFGNYIKGANLIGKLGATGRMAAFGNRMLAGAAVDFFVDGTTESRLANVLVENDVFRNALTEYLAAKDDDNVFEARLKNAMEGFLVGSTLDVAMLGFKKMKDVIGKSSIAEKLTRRGEVVDEAVEELSEKAAKETAQETAEEAAEQTTKTAKEAAEDAAKEKVFKEGAKKAGLNGDSFTETIMRIRRGEWKKYSPLNPNTVHPDLHKDIYANADAIRDYIEHNPAVRENMDEGYRWALSMSDDLGDVLNASKEALGKSRESAGTLSKYVHGLYGLSLKISPELHERVLHYSALTQEVASLKELGKEVPKEMLDTLAGHREVLRTLVEAQTQIFGYTAEARSYVGQLLQSLKNDAKVPMGSVKSLFGDGQVVRDFISKMTPQQLDDYIILLDTASQVTDGMARLGRDVVDYLKHAKGPISFSYSFSDWLKHWWYGSVLSGPATHFRNMISNGINMFVIHPFDVVFGQAAEGWQAAATAGTSKIGGMLDGFSTGLNMVKEYRKGVVDSWQKAYQAWIAVNRSGAAAFDAGVGKLDSNLFADMLKRGTRSNRIMRALSLPTRLLSMEDEMFKQLAYGGELRAQFVKESKTTFKNLLDDAFKKGGKALYEQEYSRLMSEYCSKGYRDIMLGLGLVGKGMGAANPTAAKEVVEMAFQAPLGKTMGILSKGLSNMPFGWMIAPFVKTPTNIMKQTYYHSPIGLLRLLYSDGTKNPALRSKIIGQFATGCMMWGIAGSLYASGMITGSGPSDREARDALRENGWQPNSIKVGNQYFGIGSFEPVCAPFILLANFFEKISNLDPRNPAESESYIASAINAVMSYAGDKTFLKGFADVANAFQQENGTKKFLIDKVNSFVPNIMVNMYQAFDDETKEARSWVNGIASRIPGVAGALPTRYSWLTGKPITYLHGGGLGPFSPTHWTSYKGDGVLDVLAKSHHAMNRPNRTVIGMEMDDAMYSEYCRLHGTVKVGGKTLMQALDKLIHSSVWKNAAPDLAENTLSEQKEMLIQRVVQKYRKATTAQYFKLHPDVRDAVRARQIELKQLKKGIIREPEIAGPSLFGNIIQF